MKKYWVALSAVCLLAVACGSNSNSEKPETTPPAAESHESAANDISKDPNYQKGLKLVAQNDCLTCHKVSGQSTGPSYEEVANKYTNDETTINMLAQKIIDGGSGHWGTVPMTAHPTLKPEDAKQMVKYVLLLGKK
ncbi:c-type cytochrome [Arachidicoccus terrestris]|uniref:c-type cytochrome n=1 Tax=Arachidicoccus terrestris TaxID=2875539 RepID=UPI001CC6396C|nr:c-type cytochrome [Arachidicoccus terrestris]UAY56462.1 c-type cytochrome [Arachidicoccus terrestris]